MRDETGPYYAAQTGLELTILSGFTCFLYLSFLTVVGVESGALHMLVKH